MTSITFLNDTLNPSPSREEIKNIVASTIKEHKTATSHKTLIPRELLAIADVNVRKTPRINGKIISVLHSGQEVIVIEDLAKYYYITFFDFESNKQVTGFVSKSYLKSK